ncbi:putative nucleotidyltransferase, ribonuclease H [Tanacetum coccineum]
MTESQSPEEGVGRVLPELRVMKPHSWSVTSFPPDDGHPSTTLASQKGNTSRTIDMKLNKRPSITGKKGAKNMEQVRLVRKTVVGYDLVDYTSRKRPRGQAEQWLDNEISFPSTPGCQLVDSPIILEALIEGFLFLRSYETRTKLKESRTPLVGFSSEVSYPIGTINVNVTMGESERLRTIPMEFAVVKSHSLYNVILGRTGLRSLGAVASIIHSMIKFPTANGIATVTTKKETLHECRRMEEEQGLTQEEGVIFQTPDFEGTISIGREKSQGQTNKEGDPEGPLESKPLEKVVIYDDYPVQSVTIRGNLSAEYRSRLIEILQKHVDAFAWTPADMTGIPSFIAEHELKTYPHIEPEGSMLNSLHETPINKKTVSIAQTEESSKRKKGVEWLKDVIVRRVRYPTWVANPVLVKKLDGSWRMCIDFKDLNKSCPKDLYPLPEIDWKIESLMGIKYKCFLDAYKGYHQIQITKKDEEKTTFHTDEGVFCYTKMPFRLKNARATYQRLVDTIFEGQIGRNLEAYVDDMVIKSKTELEMIKDIEETFLTLKKVNMKVNPKRCSFGRDEGKSLGYIVTFEGIRANPEKEKAIVNMPSPTNLKKMQRLSGKLAALNKFLSKVAKKALPCLDTLKRCTNKKDFHWTTEAEEAYQEMKKLIAELPTLTTPKKEEELMGIEINYPPIKKLVLALVHAARRLRSGPHDTLAEGKSREEQEAPKAKAPENLGTEADLWKLYTDGASNEHGSRAGLILIDPKGAEYSYALRLNFANSNNDAEYEALLAGLRIAAKIKVEKMHTFVDSKLVASQVEGSYEAKSEKTKKYKEKTLEMIRSFNNFQISHIPREDNKRADALSKLAAVQCEGLTKGVLIEELNERSVDTTKVNAIDEEATRTRMTPIQEYIKHGILPEDATEQAKYLIKEIYTGSCGIHDGPRRAVHKAMNAGYFWPSMHRDANNEVSSCDSCQVYSPIPKLPKNDMISVTSAWPFRKWGMDIVGPLPEASGKVKYLIVAVDYFTKWIEAKAVTSITGRHVKNFAFDNIVCRFGIPATIITDNGINDPFKSWAEGLE